MEKIESETLARKYLEYASNTMLLEGQELTDEENKKMLEKWIKKLMLEEEDGNGG